ncbi:MAG: glycosyl hydrolase 53 family protein [Ruminiclostridium sp.]
MQNTKKAISLVVVCALIISVFASTGIPVFALSGTAEYSPIESNLSAKYWVTATASSNPGDASLAIDGDNQTVWVADTTDTQRYIELDLGGAYDAVRKTEVVFAGNKAAYQYKIEGSKDKNGWYILADRTGNTRVAGGFTDVFSHEGTRYIRLTIMGGSPVGVREFNAINYLRDDMRNGSDMSEQGGNTNTYYYNAANNPPQTGYRGGKFTDAGSIEKGNNIFGLANDLGWDVVRLRVWNEPKNENNGNPNNNANNCSPANTLRVAKAVAGAGMDLAIDFHYADSWSDPQNQPKPYSWAALPFDELVKTTYDFTYNTLSDLVKQGTPPNIVAIGNEITNGMMWGKEYDDINGVDHHDYYNKGLYSNEYGGGILWKYWHQDQVTPEQYQQYLDSCQRLARLVDAGIRAVRKVAADNNINIETEVHSAFNVVEGQAKEPLPESEKLPKVLEFIKQLNGRLNAMGSSIDRLGVSYYQDWHGSWSVLQRNLVEIAKAVPGVKLNIAECSPSSSGTAKGDNNHPDGFAYTTQSQGDDTAELLKIINDVPDNRGQGVWPWAGTNVFFKGSGANGTANSSMKVWTDAYTTSVVESGVYATTNKGAAPVLPPTVKNLNVATGEITDVPVTWDTIDPASYTEAGTFTVKGTAASTGNMNKVTASVTVLGISADLVGLDKVTAGEELDVDLTLTNYGNVPESVNAADITVNYDANLFEFVKGDKGSDKIAVYEQSVEENGDLHIIAALTGNNVIAENDKLVKLKFKAKKVNSLTSGNIEVKNVKLGTVPSGSIIEAHGDILRVTVTEQEPNNGSNGNNSGSNNSSSNNSGGSSPAPVQSSVKIRTSPDESQVTYTVDIKPSIDQSTGLGSVKLVASIANELAAKAKEAKTAGKKAEVEIKIESTTNDKALSIEIPRDPFKRLAEESEAIMTITSGIGSFSFDSKAMKAINNVPDIGDISISIAKTEPFGLTPEVQTKVGDRPVYDLSVKAGNTEISTFNGGNVRISLPYSPKPGENENAIVVYYIENDGNIKTVRGRYDASSGSVMFTASNFSRYAIAYNEVGFKDVAADAWYSDAVGFIAAREITEGTGNGNYGPEAKLTRGQFITMLMKAYDISPDANPRNNFADGGNTYYSGYLSAAKRLGITAGTGGNKFGPELKITRQEMFTLLYNALKASGELPENYDDGQAISAFSDEHEVAEWAKEAMSLFTLTNIINGSGGKIFPSDITNRAEMAQVLYKLLSQ